MQSILSLRARSCCRNGSAHANRNSSVHAKNRYPLARSGAKVGEVTCQPPSGKVVLVLDQASEGGRHYEPGLSSSNWRRGSNPLLYLLQRCPEFHVHLCWTRRVGTGVARGSRSVPERGCPGRRSKACRCGALWQVAPRSQCNFDRVLDGSQWIPRPLRWLRLRPSGSWQTGWIRRGLVPLARITRSPSAANA